MAEVNDDAGEEAGFGATEQEACAVEFVGCTDEADEDGAEAPGDEDAGDPFAGAVALDDEGAGDFEEEVTDEEDACAEAEGGFREAEVCAHGGFGEGDVGAVEEGDDVEEEDVGEDAATDLAEGGSGDGVWSLHGWATGYQFVLERNRFEVRSFQQYVSSCVFAECGGGATGAARSTCIV